MDNIKVSVIIPVYNVAPYLGECLDSVINQTLKEIEIICIDDCSTDNSYQILEEYAKKDDRIKLLKHNENSGLGPARNTGIKNSSGEYVGFIDSDDYISLDFFENLYNTAKKYNSDICYTTNLYRYEKSKGKYHFNFHISNFLSEKEKKNFHLYSQGENNINIINQKFNDKNYAFVTAWNKIYRTNFLKEKNIYFMNINARSEDVDFFCRILFFNPKTSFNHNAIYYYRLNSNSIMTKSDINKDINAIKHFDNSINFYKEKNNHIYLKYLYTRLWNSIYFLYDQSKDKNLFYNHIYDFAKKIEVYRDITPKSIYDQYVLIKSNDTYEKYLLAKEMFDKINSINNKINELEKKINQLNSNITKVNEANTNNVYKKDTNIKLFGIDKLNDRKIIYIFGIKITIE